MATPRILIVGAGPTGLVLALTLAKKGVPFRIIDNDSGPGQYSRAIAIHARTLEIYRALGVASDFIPRGAKMERFKFRARNRAFVEISLADMGRGQSPYPFTLGLPQDEHEAFLVGKLHDLGVHVDWGVTLKTLKHASDIVEVELTRGPDTEKVAFDYVCGCDGASSKVRSQLGVEFSGGTFEDLFYVADVQPGRAPDADMIVNLGTRMLALLMPIKTSGMHRIVGLVPHEMRGRQNLTFEDIRPEVERLVDVKTGKPNWFSTYRVHHRVADKFKIGRCFLLGDAGHVHSPAGGQGMNTGIGDAFNLAWKLADVVTNRMPEKLLDSYEIERIAFARKLVASTDRAFEVMTGAGAFNGFLRTWILPGLLSRATRFAAVRSMIFKVISQTRIRYRQSPISSGVAGEVHGGDRLPWVAFSDGSDNFAPLTSLDWQVHVYGALDPAFERAADELAFKVIRFDFNDQAKHAGLAEGAAYLVRPDGYIGLAQPRQDTAELKRYWTNARRQPAPATQTPV